MTEQRFYKVGGHTFEVDYPKDILSEKELSPYAPFRTDFCSANDTLFNLTLKNETESPIIEGPIMADLEDENGRMKVFTQEDECLSFILFSKQGNECCRIQISKDFRKATAWVGGSEDEHRYALDTTLMLLYTFASSIHNTLLLHASAVEFEGKGYLFLGKSGTGKSTHSRLWTENIEGSQLLNDDNPILHIIDGTAYVYGSPWSGKTPCYRNCQLPLGSIVRLHQAPFNRINPLHGIKAYAALLPSCSCMKWNHEMAEAIHATISKVIEKVPVYTFECLPDKNAAMVCYETVVGTHGSCVREQSSTKI